MDFIIDEQAFDSKAGRFKALTLENTSEGEIMLKYASNCAEVFEQAFGRLFIGGKTRFERGKDRIVRVCNAMEFRQHTDAILSALYKLKIDPFSYTSGEAVLFLYLYSQLKRYLEKKSAKLLTSDNRRRCNERMRASVEKIIEAVDDFDEYRREELPMAAARWWESVDEYFEKLTDADEFDVETALKI